MNLPPLPLPAGVRSRWIDTAHGLHMHLLEAGHEDHHTHKPLVLLLHGFPELAYSWRHQLTALAAAGFHVVAPDQRGYGRTTGGDDRFDGDWQASGMLHLVDDVLDLLQALGRTHVDAVVGHDFGSPVAAWCALTRPDVFRSVVMMSAPFGGPPDAHHWSATHAALSQEVNALAQLSPPRQHYQWYYSDRQANEDMWHPPQGLHAFLRAYYHVKSADWSPNQPHPLSAWRADVLAELPAPRMLVLGDMGEVGQKGPEFHAEVGAYAKARGIEALLTLGDLCQHSSTAFEGAKHFGDMEALKQYVLSHIAGQKSLVIKGSRFMKMERLVEALRERTESAQVQERESVHAA
mgnify:CR=1 FL=1